MQVPPSNYYGTSAISHSLRHLVLGKGFKMFSSLATVVMVARFFNQHEYAAYVSFQALTSVLGDLVAGQAVLFRYLPELRTAGNNLATYRLLFNGMLFRGLLIGTLMFLLVPFLPTLADWFKLADWLWLLPWYFGIGFVRLLVFSLSVSLESLLWQKQAQYSQAISNILKLIAVISLIVTGSLDLLSLVVVEASCEGLTLVLLVYSGCRAWFRDERRHEGNLSWLDQNRQRMLRYGIWSFFLNQSRILYGSAPNRLATAHYLTTTDLATFGFADSLSNLARRIMPTSLLIAFIRPIFVARYSSSGDFSLLTRMTDLIFRLNTGIFLLPIVLLIIAGKPLFEWITDGKYGVAAALLAGFLVLLIMEGIYRLMEVLAQTVEKNHIMVFTNLIQSSTLLLAIPFFPLVGIWALILANIAGTALATVVVLLWLQHCGYRTQFNLNLLMLLFIYAGAGALLGWQVMSTTGSAWLALCSIVGVFALSCIIKPPLSKDEIALLIMVLKNNKSGKAIGHL